MIKSLKLGELDINEIETINITVKNDFMSIEAIKDKYERPILSLKLQ